MNTPKKRPTRAARQRSREREEGDFAVRFHRIDEIGHGLRYLVKWGSIVLCARYGYLSLAALAGKATNAQIALVVKYLTEEPTSSFLSWVLPWCVAGGCVTWALIEKYLRRKFIASSGARIRELETLVDPQRTSSYLTKHGDTPPEGRS